MLVQSHKGLRKLIFEKDISNFSETNSEGKNSFDRMSFTHCALPELENVSNSWGLQGGGRREGEGKGIENV